MTARSEDFRRGSILQEEEVQITPVQETANNLDLDRAFTTTDTSVEDIELQVEAPVPSVPLDSIVDNLMQSQAPRIVEVEEGEGQEEAEPILQSAEQESDVDLVDKLVWEYMESSNL